MTLKHPIFTVLKKEHYDIFIRYKRNDIGRIHEICIVIMDNTKDLIVLESESGLFYVDANGIAQRFEALYNNPFFEIMPLVKTLRSISRPSVLSLCRKV